MKVFTSSHGQPHAPTYKTRTYLCAQGVQQVVSQLLEEGHQSVCAQMRLACYQDGLRGTHDVACVCARVGLSHKQNISWR